MLNVNNVSQRTVPPQNKKKISREDKCRLLGSMCCDNKEIECEMSTGITQFIIPLAIQTGWGPEFFWPFRAFRKFRAFHCDFFLFGVKWRINQICFDNLWIPKLEIHTLSTCTVFFYSFFSQFHFFTHFLFFLDYMRCNLDYMRCNKQTIQILSIWYNIMDESLRARRIKAVGSLCTACNWRFSNRFAYDQHRTSPILIGTQCYALQR